MHPSEKNFLCAEIFPEPPSLTEVRPQKVVTVIDPEADTRLSRSLCPVVDDFLREPVCRIRRQVFDKYLPQTGRRIQLPVFKPGKIGAVAERDDVFTDGAVNNQLSAEIVP